MPVPTRFPSTHRRWRVRSLIDEIAARFGSQVCVVAIDARCVDGDWQCFTHGGSRPAGRGLFEWAAEAERRGAGELLFTSMDHDGVKQGLPAMLWRG